MSFARNGTALRRSDNIFDSDWCVETRSTETEKIAAARCAADEIIKNKKCCDANYPTCSSGPGSATTPNYDGSGRYQHKRERLSWDKCRRHQRSSQDHGNAFLHNDLHKIER